MCYYKTGSPKALDALLLIPFPIIYLWNISHYFWTLPVAADPLGYLGGVASGTTYMFYPWLDRIMVAVGLRFFSLFSDPVYLAGPIYIGAVNLAMLVLGMVWTYRKAGFVGALCLGVFWNCSLLLLGWSTYVYTDQSLAFYSLAAFLVFSELEDKHLKLGAFLCGVLSAFAITSKITGIPTVLFFSGWLLLRRRLPGLLWYGAGGAVGILTAFALYALSYNVESLVNTVSLFFDTSFAVRRVNFVSFVDEIILSLKYFPFIALFILWGGCRNRRAGPPLGMAWTHVAFMLLLYAFTRRGGDPWAHYLYTPYVFLLIGLSVVLGSAAGSEEKAAPSALRPALVKGLWVAGIVFLLLAGRSIAINTPAVADYHFSFLHGLKMSVFDSERQTTLHYPAYVRLIYMLGPITVMVLLIASLRRREEGRNLWVALLLPAVALWSMSVNGSLAYAKASYERKNSHKFFSQAQALGKVKAEKYYLFAKEWSKVYKGKRMLWVYHLFFDPQLDDDRSFDSRYRRAKDLAENVIWLNHPHTLISGENFGMRKDFWQYTFMLKGRTAESLLENVTNDAPFEAGVIVTDRPHVIKEYWPESKVIQVIATDDAGNHPLYEMSFGTTVVKIQR